MPLLGRPRREHTGSNAEPVRAVCSGINNGAVLLTLSGLIYGLTARVGASQGVTFDLPSRLTIDKIPVSGQFAGWQDTPTSKCGKQLQLASLRHKQQNLTESLSKCAIHKHLLWLRHSWHDPFIQQGGSVGCGCLLECSPQHPGRITARQYERPGAVILACIGVLLPTDCCQLWSCQTRSAVRSVLPVTRWLFCAVLVWNPL